MSKKEFLQRLSQGLDLLDEIEKREIIGFYEERFHSGTKYEGKTEEEVVSELESPETIARNVLEEYGINPKYIKTKEQRYSHIDSGQVVGVALFDVFIASWLVPAVFSIAFGLFAALISYVAVVPLIIGEQTIVDQYMFAFLTAGYILLFFIALAILDLSIGLIKRIIVWHLNVFKFKNREKWIKKFSRVSLDRVFKSSGTMKFIKSILIIGSIVTIGYTGYHLFFSSNQYFATYANTEKQTEEYFTDYVEGDAWNVVTNLDSVDVKIVPSEREDIYVSYTYTDRDGLEIDIDETSNTITLTQEIEVISFFDFREIVTWFVSPDELIIEVPEELVFDLVDVSVVNGELDISDVNVDRMNVDLLNGKVVIDHLLLSSDLDVQVTNGSIYVYDTSSPASAELITVNGSIIVKNVQFSTYVLETENGKIDLDDLNTDLQDGVLLDAQTTNGSIDLNNVYVLDVVLETTNGSIDYFNEDLSFILDDLDVSTVNGSYVGNVQD